MVQTSHKEYGTSAITSTQNNLGLLNESVESASGSAMSNREFESHRNMLERENQQTYDLDD
jgi:hypothetical protein